MANFDYRLREGTDHGQSNRVVRHPGAGFGSGVEILFGAARSGRKEARISRHDIGILPHGDGEVGACLFASSEETPSEKGAMIYLNVNGRLDDAITAVASNGGKVVKPKHAIGPFGFRAVVIDSEGNRVALHSD